MTTVWKGRRVRDWNGDDIKRIAFKRIALSQSRERNLFRHDWPLTRASSDFPITPRGFRALRNKRARRQLCLFVAFFLRFLPKDYNISQLLLHTPYGIICYFRSSIKTGANISLWTLFSHQKIITLKFHQCFVDVVCGRCNADGM